MKSDKQPVAHQALGGIILIFVGFLFLLDSLNMVHFGHLISNWWPLVLIIIGLIKLNDSKPAGVLLLVLGGIFLSATLFNLRWDWLWRFWPLILIYLGYRILVQNRSPQGGAGGKKNRSGQAFFRHSSIFGGGEHKNNSTELAGGELITVFGSIELDLRGSVPLESCKIVCTAIFGGIEVVVPKEWQINVAGTPLFGSVSDNTQPPETPEDRRAITLIGTALFGSIELKN